LGANEPEIGSNTGKVPVRYGKTEIAMPLLPMVARSLLLVRFLVIFCYQLVFFGEPENPSFL